MNKRLEELLAADEIDMTSLVPIEKVVKLKVLDEHGRETVQTFKLCEPDGEAVRMYKNLSMRAAKFGADGKLSTLEGVADVETQLVGDCLYTVGPNGAIVRKVGLGFAKKLNNRVLKPLFDMAKKMGEIDEEVETIEFLEKRMKEDAEKIERLKKDNPLKNGQGSTAVSSSSADSSNDQSTS